MLDQTVDTLMTDDAKSFDAELVHNIFPENIASKILQVAIGRQGGDDFASWIGRQGGDDFASWPHSHFGQYTVKSAYYIARADGFAVDRSRKGQGSSSANQDDCKRWKPLWSTKAPGKMKITLWRFAHDCVINATSK
jgi:hypothetical protein